ncbi:ankyrin repeat domain-containing protein 9 [Hoplias malabaricus]|uniref:ankyrin repeat domain-containing protein 9 n=1 Tax=Hoplias malabaricus TaxID=27720 RepID=UPI0034621446
MPLDVAWRPCEDYKSESQCKRSSFAFYRAVRDLHPVWLLEEMRATEALHWEEDHGRARAFSPAEALLYALVHDHQEYARHLLRAYPSRALAAPSASFRGCACTVAAAPHLALAVRHERIAILGLMLEAAAEHFGEDERRAFLDGRGCAHGGGKSALHVACEQARGDCLLALLANGACPHVTDSAGDAPLDCLLEQMERCGDGDRDASARRACLGYLMLFVPAPRVRRRTQLLEDAARWTQLLGERVYNWVSGQAPTSLLVMCTRTLLRARAEVLLEPLPRFLKPPEFRLQQWGMME